MTTRPPPRRDLDDMEPDRDDTPACRCDGDGWVRMPPSYADSLHPPPPPLPLDASDADRAAYEAQCRSAALLRAEARDSWYPCRACRPDQFLRWAQGAYIRERRAG